MTKRQAFLPARNQTWYWISRDTLITVNKGGPISRLVGQLEKYTAGRYYLDNHSIAFDTKTDAELFKFMYNLTQ